MQIHDHYLKHTLFSELVFPSCFICVIRIMKLLVLNICLISHTSRYLIILICSGFYLRFLCKIFFPKVITKVIYIKKPFTLKLTFIYKLFFISIPNDYIFSFKFRVSPPGGDFSDPVTSATLGIVQVYLF